MQEDGVVPLLVQLAPRLIGQVQLGDDPAMLEVELVPVLKQLVAPQGLPIRPSDTGSIFRMPEGGGAGIKLLNPSIKLLEKS